MKHIRIGLILPLLFGCSNKKMSMSMPDMASPPPPPPPLAMACKDAPADVYTLPSGLPAYDSSHRGDVIRCAPAGYLSTAEVNAELTAYGYKGAPAKSGFWMWKLAFRTERIPLASAPAGSPNPEGVSSALFMVPDHPVKNGPLVVFAHGSVSLGDDCAPSRTDLTAPVPPPSKQWDHPVNLLSLGGYGYTVIMPDYAGFGFNEPPGYFIAEDEAHGVLDSTRAAAHLLPAAAQVASSLPVVIVGHSQGGHAALAAQSFAASYGHAGNLVGVANLAPFWTSMSAWAAITTALAGVRTTDPAKQYEITYSLDYFYSAGELRDGPGGGVAMYIPSKQAMVKDFVTSSTCFDFSKLPPLGNTPADFFDPTFVNDVGYSCSIGGDCSAADSTLWLGRWREDRPALDPNGPPVLNIYGGMDTNITPSYAQCAIDKFNKDLGAGSTLVSYCYDDKADHNSIVRLDEDYVNQWVGARAGVNADPAPCTPFPSGIACGVPPQNL